MQTEKSQHSGKRNDQHYPFVNPRTGISRSASDPTFSIDLRVVTSRSASETDVRFYFASLDDEALPKKTKRKTVRRAENYINLKMISLVSNIKMINEIFHST